MAAATLVSARANAMRTAASSESGATTGFMGLGMARGAGGINAQSLFALGQQQQALCSPAPAPATAAAPAAAYGRNCSKCGKSSEILF